MHPPRHHPYATRPNGVWSHSEVDRKQRKADDSDGWVGLQRLCLARQSAYVMMRLLGLNADPKPQPR
jgi:hypothetical protein